MGFKSQQGQNIFVFSKMSRPALLPTHLPIQLVLEVLSSGLKQPGCKADHTPPSRAKVKDG
jgi:hypothetical protein